MTSLLKSLIQSVREPEGEIELGDTVCFVTLGGSEFMGEVTAWAWNNEGEQVALVDFNFNGSDFRFSVHPDAMTTLIKPNGQLFVKSASSAA